eukprot:GHVU01120635.1.p1 GENE.GHVU01120635.1~~GHVU01120635.1.p1  ORF type:complete len:181 (+),score=17.19 GHVU01120635.1:183-725(+)
MAVTIAFTVEDGTGVTDATSYISIADADTYTTTYLATTTDWVAASDDEKALALNVASRYLDRKYGQRYKGTERKLSTQGLLWPRYGALTQDGYDLGLDEVPTMLEQATVEVASYQISNGTVYPETGETGQLSAKKIKLDVLEISEEFLGGNAKSEVASKVDDLMWELLDGNGSGLRIARG